MIPYHQMTLADVFTETQEIFETDKPEFLKLLESSIDLSDLISVSFRNHFYASTGRPREYSLTSLLWALIIQRIFSIPTDSLLLTFLEYSRDLREFCGFTKVPDASKITRFKAEAAVAAAKSKYDAALDELEKLVEKRKQQDDKKVLAAYHAGNKTADEIVAFIESNDSETV